MPAQERAASRGPANGPWVITQNLNVTRICLHQIHVHSDPVYPPIYGSGLLTLKANALSAFHSRVNSAFKSAAHCMDMAIRDFGPGSVLANGAHAIKTSDNDFVTHSRLFADALAAAQGSRQIPGGILAVFDGTLGNPSTPFFGLMKAEIHDGFSTTKGLQAQFLDNLFLSPRTKLYKIGLFVSDATAPRPPLPGGWAATVFDSAMSAAQRDNAATYFYSKFLGLDIPLNAARQVKTFFEQTKLFIKSTNLPQSEKTNLYNSLYAYIKLDKSSTIQTSSFAATYLDQDIGDDYIEYMRKKSFPTSAINKDISEIAGVLRLRKFKFPRSITLSGPPEAVNDLVTVDTINGDGDQPWTQVIIKAQLQAQE